MLGVVLFEHFLGHSITHTLDQKAAQGVADKARRGEQQDFARGNGYGKRTDELPLVGGELLQSQFGNKRNALPALDHAHKGLDAAEGVGAFALPRGLEVAELYELVAEAMTLVQEPQRLVHEVGCLDTAMVEKLVAARNVRHELLEIERFGIEASEVTRCHEYGGIDFVVGKGFFELDGF